jgi:fatty acid desaturase
MNQSAQSSNELLRTARDIIADLRRPIPWIYWVDLIVTFAVAWGSLTFATIARSATVTATMVAVTSLALVRGTMFLHELAHMQRAAVPGFRVAWNVLIGIPLGLPSFMFERPHLDHHRLAVYRTENDPEHAPSDSTLVERIAISIPVSAGLPILLAFRWLILGPISWLFPRLRRWVEARASALLIHRTYVPSPLRGTRRIEAIAAEWACTAWFALVGTSIAAGYLPSRGLFLVALAQAIAAWIALQRVELLHRFGSNAPIGTLQRQVFDSVNLPHDGVLSALLLPVGIGYHALHHLDPRLPYHALDAAHRRLLAALPAGSAYHLTECDGILHAVHEAIERDRSSVDDARHEPQEEQSLPRKSASLAPLLRSPSPIGRDAKEERARSAAVPAMHANDPHELPLEPLGRMLVQAVRPVATQTRHRESPNFDLRGGLHVDGTTRSRSRLKRGEPFASRDDARVPYDAWPIVVHRR